MERTLDVRTGESIAVRYELAGLGSRFLAVSLDMTIQLLAVLLMFLIVTLLTAPIASVAAHVHFGKTARAIMIGLLSALVFALVSGYFIVFELFWNGRTPGKRALGIRVVRDGGLPIDVGAAVVRNVVRLAELTIGAYLVSAVIALLSPENKRLGDFAAGTIVVRERPDDRHALDDLAFVAAVRSDGVTREDRALIERFLARRATLEPQARRNIAARIASRVRPDLQASFDHLDDESLLEHLGPPGLTFRIATVAA